MKPDDVKWHHLREGYQVAWLVDKEGNNFVLTRDGNNYSKLTADNGLEKFQDLTAFELRCLTETALRNQ